MEIGIGTLLIIAIAVSGSLSLFNLFCKFKLGTLKKVFIVWVMRFFCCSYISSFEATSSAAQF